MPLKVVAFLFCLSFFLGNFNLKPKQSGSSPSMVMSDSLLAAYYFNNSTIDDLGSHDGLLVGAETTTDRFSSTVSAYRFNGEQDHIDLAADFTEGYDSLSVSIWIYPFTSCAPIDTMTIDPSLNQYFLSSGGVGESTGIYGIWNQGSLLVGQSLTGSHSEHEYHTFLDDSLWHHIVMLFDAFNEEATVYVNGELVFTLDYELGSSSNPSDSLFIGASNFETGNGFLGKVDDVKFYNRLLNDTDIANLYKEDCPDSLYFSELHISSDTFLYANSTMRLDSLSIDSSCTFDLISPVVQLVDTTLLNSTARLRIWDIDGCKHSESAHQAHFNHRGVYINRFVSDGILGNEGKEDSLLSWCLLHEFNQVYLYNIGTAFSSGMQVELDSFVHKANNLELAVTFVSAGFGTSFDNMVAYHTDFDHIPQGIVSEIEFWNGSGEYAIDYEPWLNRLDSLKLIPPSGETVALNPSVSRRFYIGKIKNPGEPPSIAIAEDLIAHHDEIFLTNYHSNGYNLSTSSSENSIRNKLSLLGEAARNLGREVNIVILFNVRQDSPAPNIWTYFSESHDDHDFRAGYEKWYHDFINASDIEFKKHINLKGFGVYRWTDAKEARTF